MIDRMLTQADTRLRVMRLAVTVRIKTEKQRLRAGRACLVRRPAARALLSARRSWGKVALAKRELWIRWCPSRCARCMWRGTDESGGFQQGTRAVVLEERVRPVCPVRRRVETIYTRAKDPPGDLSTEMLTDARLHRPGPAANGRGGVHGVFSGHWIGRCGNCCHWERGVGNGLGAVNGAESRVASRRAPGPVTVRSTACNKLPGRPPVNVRVSSRLRRVDASISNNAPPPIWRGRPRRGSLPTWVNST